MSEQTKKPNEQKAPQPLVESLQALFESFRRAEIGLPQAIILAAILIALGLIFS
jgi:hypothetical protein